MKRFFDNELETFRSHLMLMGESSIRQVRLALKALVDGDAALADQVIAADDEIDRLEMQIDNEAIAYMNLRAPVATELRLVIVGMKASHDLERVGDEATSIAKRAVRLAAEPPLKPYVDIPRMANIALEMLRDALDAAREEADRYRNLCAYDADSRTLVFLDHASIATRQFQMARLAAELGVAGRARFLGWRDDTADLLAAADILACPSRHEPLGNVVIEGWAHGLPVVAAASDGPRELVRDGETGLLVPVEDAAALAAALASVIADGPLRARLTAAGRAAYEADFTEARVVARYLAFFAAIERPAAGAL